MKEDRRSRGRYGATYPVTMITSQGTKQGEMRNVSANGAFIACEEPLDVGEKVCLCIEFRPGVAGEVDAEVIWSNASGPYDKMTPRGMGVRFLW